MPGPLDYFNPKRAREQARMRKVVDLTGADDSGPEQSVWSAVPVEFDSLVTESRDQPAVRAILRALEREKLAYHLSHDGRIADRTLRIFVHSAHLCRAAEVAAVIFMRRKKFKSYPMPKMPGVPDSAVPGLTSDWL